MRSNAEADRLREQLRHQLRRLADEGLWALPASAPEPVAEAVTAASTRPAAPPFDVAVAAAPPLLELLTGEVRVCTLCALHRERTQVVVGVGNPSARVMFVGEGPGREEDLRGEPFVGPAGKLLDRMIEAMGLTRPEVYIANAVKCRPPGNRNPEPEEFDACRPFLLRQIAAIRPRVLVLLGRIAAQSLLGTDMSLARLRGRFLEFDGIPVMCTYHPAFLLRQPENKRKAWEDLQMVMALLARESS